MNQLVDYYLNLPDAALAAAYSDWSERTYAATWLSDGIPLFVKVIVRDNKDKPTPLKKYEIEGVAELRRLLQAAKEDREWSKESG